jgi:sugar O-acyltransferase (sialic acid O-acetyltransferase NeuD family)
LEPDRRCVILGGGGHAKVVIDCLRAARSLQPVGILDPDPRRSGQVLLDVPILGGDELLTEIVRRGIPYFVVGLGSTDNHGRRRRLFEFAVAAGLKPGDVIHPSAVCSPWSQRGPGCQVLPAAVINAGAVLGRGVIVNSGAIVEHDCRLGDFLHMASGAKLAGGVQVGDGAHIGAGATVRQGIRIGDGALVGLGAAVVKDVAADTVVMGVPARERLAVNG